MPADLEEQLTGEVLARLSATSDPRLREVMRALVLHLHVLARELRLTEAEWAAARSGYYLLSGRFVGGPEAGARLHREGNEIVIDND